MSLTVPVDTLLNLPSGAVFRRSNDRAHVEASAKGGVIYITGTCDSLQREVEYYEALYHNARDALEATQDSLRTQQSTSGRPYPGWLLTLTFMLGSIGGATVSLLIVKPKKKK